jgi:hypothetical protein
VKKSSLFSVAVVTIGLFTLLRLPARGQTFQFQEDVNGYQMGAVDVFSDQPAVNREGGNGLTAGVAGQNPGNPPLVRRTLISYHLSSLPDGALISNISFTLTIDQGDANNGTTAIPLQLYLIGGFDEATVTYNTQPTSTTLLASISLVPASTTSGQTITWTATPAFLAAAQAASNANGSLNFVVRLDDANEASGTRNVFFFDSDDTLTVPVHPLLIVTVPEPSSLLFTLLGGPALFLAAVRQGRRKST